MLLYPEKLNGDEQKVIKHLLQLSPEVGKAQELARGFIGIVQGRRVDELREWLISAHA